MRHIRLLLFLPILIAFLSSCDKTEKSGYGNYIISVSNSTSQAYWVTPVLDGESQGQFFINANYTVSWSVTSPCDDLVQTANMNNCRIFTYVPNGHHTFELIDNVSNTVMSTVTFDMTADGCVHQHFYL
jgi:hypothetical protein